MPTRKCPTCGADISPNAPEGLCPACVARSLGELIDSDPPSCSALTTSVIGTVFTYFGNYQIIEQIGSGGMGVVFKAQQHRPKRLVALKLITAGALARPELVQRFAIEAEAAAKLSHPGIVEIYEISEYDGQPYFSMRLIEGPSLSQKLAGQPMAGREVAGLTIKISRAVHYAHQRGVLHRDIKPSNILLDAKGEPYLTDFGLAKLAEQDSQITHTSAVLGAPSYMSPEQARGESKQITTATDVYGLGTILYEMLTGKPPFAGGTSLETIRLVVETDAPPPSLLNSTVDRDLETICLKCLEKEPARRYGSAEELAADLQRFLERRPIQARPVTWREKTWKWVRRNPWRAAACGVGPVAAVSILSFLVLLNLDKVKARENEALLQLRLGTAERLTGFPKSIEWRQRAAQHLHAAKALSDRLLYRNQLTANLEDLDASLIGKHAAFQNAQVVFDDSSRSLRLAGAAGINTWRYEDRSGTNFSDLESFPGKPVAFPDGSTVQILQSDAEKLTVWQAFEQRALCALALPDGFSLRQPDGQVLSAISRNLNRLVLTLRDSQNQNALGVFEIPSGRILKTVMDAEATTSLAISPDGQLIADGNSMGVVTVRNGENFEIIARFSVGSLPTRCLAFAPSLHRQPADSSVPRDWLLAAGNDGGTIGIWDVAHDRIKAVCRGGHYQVFSLAFSVDGMTLASGGRGPVRLWDAATGKPLLDLSGADYCGALAFSKDGRRLAASTQHQTRTNNVLVWELENGRGISTLRGLVSGAIKVAYSPRGDKVAAVGMGWEVAVWDLEPERLLHIFTAPQGFTADNSAIAFSPDSSLLAISCGQEAQLWDVLSGQLIRRWTLPPALADCLIFASTKSLYLFRMETLQGKEMPLSNAPWPEYPRVCRIRNLLGSEPLKPTAELKDFNMGIFDVSPSAARGLFAVEGIGSSENQRRRSVIVVDADSGRRVWEVVSTNTSGSSKVFFSSAGSRVGYKLNGRDWFWTALDAPSKHRDRFSYPPVAIGPDGLRWASWGEETGFGRGVSLFESEKLILNLGFDADILSHPNFDSRGRLLAWGNKDGTVTVCDIQAIEKHFKELGLRLR